MISKCINDNYPVDECINLGSIPIVNNFNSKVQKTKYNLTMGLCRKCKLFQIQKNINPSKLFSNYAHISSGSKSNLQHIKNVFNFINRQKKIKKTTRILEIGCNDGSLLNFFRKKTKKIVGIDPAKNLVKKILNNYEELIPDFFNEKNGKYLLSKYKKFDVIVALNVIPHTVNVREIMNYVGKLLSDDGIFLMEGAYFFDTIYKGKFDTIYHEHVSSFTLFSLKNIFDQAKLKIHYAKQIPVQGGSLRVIAKKKSSSNQWKKIYKLELNKKVSKLNTYRKTGKLIKKISNSIKAKFNILTKGKTKAILLGAPARGVVINHVCGFDENKIIYAIDDSKTKHSKYFAGCAFKVFSWDKLKNTKYNNFVLLSWNYKTEIVKKLKKYRNSFKLLIPFPRPKLQKF